jgi:hypothetical protein
MRIQQLEKAVELSIRYICWARPISVSVGFYVRRERVLGVSLNQHEDQVLDLNSMEQERLNIIKL